MQNTMCHSDSDVPPSEQPVMFHLMTLVIVPQVYVPWLPRMPLSSPHLPPGPSHWANPCPPNRSCVKVRV